MFNKLMYLLVLIPGLMVSSCSSRQITANFPDSNGLLRALQNDVVDQLHKESIQPVADLTLDQAINLAFLYNPELGAATLEIRAAEARTLQAGLSPNPQIDVELENLAGSGAFAGTGSTESTIAVSQLVLLGGKAPEAH